MYCSKCGTEIPTGQNTCPGCYAPVHKTGGWGGWLGSLLRKLFPVHVRLESGGPGLDGMRVETKVIRKTEGVELTDGTTGETQVYHSLDEVPPEIRARIEALRASGEGVQGQQTITFKNASGREQTYHSVDEMPPDVRAIYERIRKEHGLSD